MSLSIYLGTKEEKPHKEIKLDEKTVPDDQNGYVYLFELVRQAEENLEKDKDDRVSLKGSTVSVHLPEGDVWVNCGTLPVNQKIRFPAWDFRESYRNVENYHQIKIKFDSADIRGKDEFYESSVDEYSEEDEFKKKKKKSKKIKEIVETVYLWKRMIEGLHNKKKQEMVKFKPREASELLGFPIKTLYDYMYSLK